MLLIPVAQYPWLFGLGARLCVLLLPFLHYDPIIIIAQQQQPDRTAFHSGRTHRHTLTLFYALEYLLEPLPGLNYKGSSPSPPIPGNTRLPRYSHKHCTGTYGNSRHKSLPRRFSCLPLLLLFWRINQWDLILKTFPVAY